MPVGVVGDHELGGDELEREPLVIVEELLRQRRAQFPAQEAGVRSTLEASDRAREGAHDVAQRGVHER